MNRAERWVGTLAGHGQRLLDPDTDLDRLRRLHATRWFSRALSGRRARQVEVRRHTVPVCGADLPVLVYRPERAEGRLPLVAMFHGGGFVMGDVAQTDWLASRLAVRRGAVVVAVGYRHAPEHPAPGPARDCLAAVRWLARHADLLGADGGAVTLVGVSAGATLAALVAHAWPGTGLPALQGQVLGYPATDLTLGSASVEEFADNPMIARELLDWFGRHYLPPRRGVDAADPSVSPLFADPTGLPPTMVLVAGQDPLRDDGIRYALRLRDAGISTRLILFPETLHGFLTLPVISPAAHHALAAICDFVGA